MQHRAPRNTPGRHRRTVPLHSHRAPREPIAEKGRYAVAAALVAGVGATAVTVATDGSSPAGAVAKAATPVAVTEATTPTTAIVPGIPAEAAAPVQVKGGMAAADQAVDLQQAGLPFVAQRRKAKPMPLWVNPMPEGSVTSCFGQRWGRLHAGVDIAAASGTPIHAAGKGIVVAAGPEQGYGNAVLIDHGNGFLTHYGHMSVITATVGQHVEPGDMIGEEGSTGHSTGPHLHFEVHQGSYKNPIEPTRWMHDHGVDINGCGEAG
ncbi:M23 family metallopeptidase [Actinoplanes sp. NPDC049681]|uniref:M23 family metallopeptidase n=1 Tax=Actinoplanes sp. NPDC049681 TaxID=3363905 RepID=UPI0037B0B594